MKCKKLLSTLLAISVSVSTLAAATITASAETTKKTMNLGGSFISVRDNIYYGNATKWRVLSTNGNTTEGDTVSFSNGVSTVSADKALFVISENNFGTITFRVSLTSQPNNWIGSNARIWCRGDFYTAAGITGTEDAAILTTIKSDLMMIPLYAAAPSILNDKVFYLSVNEANTYFNNNSDRRLSIGNNIFGAWWLRSPGSGTSYGDVGVVNGVQGKTSVGDASGENYSRPAFNLNLSSVLFASAASFDGTLGSYEGNEWKLTLKDSARASFAIGNVTRKGDVLTVAYTGALTSAVTDNYETISYIITDKDQTEIKYYGAQIAASETGSVNITLPDMADEDRLFVFNEQNNGAYKTNFASELQEVTVPAPATTHTITASVNDSDMGSVTSSTAAAYADESVALTATANEGYKFVGFECDDVDELFVCGNKAIFTMPDKDITVKANFTPVGASEITVKNSEAFDLNGKEITASKIVVENGGKIKDSTGGKGILKVAREELYGRNYTDQFPLYDEQNGGWRFFDCEVNAGYIEGDSSIIGTTLKFKDAETEAIAKRILASDNPGVNLDITLSKTDENGVIHRQVAEAPQGMIKSYAENLTKPILMGVSGLKPGMEISVNYRFANGLVISKEVSNATPYITLEAGADKNYIVKVYGTGLDGVVAVALYNSENQSQLIDVKIQKVAEFSGQLQGDGGFVKAMWWADFGTMIPLCSPVGKEITE